MKIEKLKALKHRRLIAFALALCLAGSLYMPAADNFVSAAAEEEPEVPETPAPTEEELATLMLSPGTDTSSLNLNWYSDDGAGDGAVKFEGEIIAAASGDATAGKKWHKVTVTGLEPGVTYEYSISDDGENFGETRTYTAPDEGDFTFVSVGDPQLTTGLQDKTSNLFSSNKTTREGWAEAVKAMTEKLGDSIDFIAGVGDQVDLSTPSNEEAVATSELEYINFTRPELLRDILYAPVVGNHDRNYGFQYHYNLPNEQNFEALQSADYGNETNDQAASTESKGNYFYKFNNSLFIALNTSAYPASTEAAEVIVDRFDRVMAEATATYPDYEWLFVQHHKSTASVADHIADRDIQYYVEAGFETLMDKYEVDFVLGGHDHVYARSYPMKGGQRADNQGGSEIVNPAGTVYVTMTTASGLKYYDLFNAAGNLYVKDNSEYPYLVNGLQGSIEYMKGTLPLSNAKYLQAKKPEFTAVHVTDDAVSFETYNIDDLSNPIDAFTVTKGAGSSALPAPAPSTAATAPSAIVPAAAAPASASPTPSASSGVQMTVNTFMLNVRSGAGVSNGVIGTLAQGDTVGIVDTSSNGNWSKISFNGGEGWVYNSYLK